MKVPEGWKKTRLAEITEVRTGLSKSSNRGGDFTELPYLRVANVQDGYLALDDVQTIPVPSGLIDRFLLKRGDLLMVEGNGNPANLGRGCLWKAAIDPCVHQNHIFCVRPNHAIIHDEFLALWMQSDPIRAHLLEGAKGSTGLASLNSTQISNIPVHYPPLPEQKAIADTLSTWDAAIEKTERLIAAKEKARSAQVTDLVFGKVRKSTTTFVESIQRQYFSHPADWDYCQIGSVGTEISEKPTGSEERLPVLSCSKYDGLVDSLEYFGKKVFSDDTSGYKVIRKGQFGYPSNHIEEGSIGLLGHRDAGLVSPIYIVFSVDSTKVYPPFLHLVLKTNLYKHIFRVNTSSSVDRRGNLRWDEFSRIHIALPSLVEQQQIVVFVDFLDGELTILRKQLDLLKLQKRGLMQKLLTGAWRVPVRNKVAS